MSYRVIQSFDHTISWKDHGYENMSNLNTYPYVSQSDDDDSTDEPLETLSNVHPALVGDFLSYHLMRPHRMFSPLIRIDRFLVDHLQSSCIFHHVQNTPYKAQRVKLGNESKYRFMYIRYHSDLRSKDHLHYSH